ncbi:MAG: hypothetical protein R3C32_04365 [Chloroflexota bacterium]
MTGAAGLETVPGTSIVLARPADIADPSAVALDLSDHVAVDPAPSRSG